MSCHTLLCNVVTLVDSHCTKILGQNCTHGLNEGKFDCTITVFRDYFCSLSSVNPPGCHRLHTPIVGKIIGPHTCMHVETCFHNCPRISVPDTAFFYVGHQMNQNKFQFLTNPPVTSTQCTYNTLSLIHNHSIHRSMLHTNQNVQ